MRFPVVPPHGPVLGQDLQWQWEDSRAQRQGFRQMPEPLTLSLQISATARASSLIFFFLSYSTYHMLWFFRGLAHVVSVLLLSQLWVIWVLGWILLTREAHIPHSRDSLKGSWGESSSVACLAQRLSVGLSSSGGKRSHAASSVYMIPWGLPLSSCIPIWQAGIWCSLIGREIIQCKICPYAASMLLQSIQ